MPVHLRLLLTPGETAGIGNRCMLNGGILTPQTRLFKHSDFAAKKVWATRLQDSSQGAVSWSQICCNRNLA